MLRFVPICLLTACTSPELVAFTPSVDRSVASAEHVEVYIEYSPADVEVTVDGTALMTRWGMSADHCYEDLCEVNAPWDTTNVAEGPHEIAVKLDGDVADVHTVTLADAFMISTFAVAAPATSNWGLMIAAVVDDTDEVLGCIHRNGSGDRQAGQIFDLTDREVTGSPAGIVYPLQDQPDPAFLVSGYPRTPPITTASIGDRRVRVEVWSADDGTAGCDRTTPSLHMFGASPARTVAGWRTATTPESFGEVSSFTTGFARIGSFVELEPDAPCVECGGCSTGGGGRMALLALVIPLVRRRRRR